MAISDWSTTAANNNSSPPAGWPESMAPAAVNNTARQMMADIRSWYGAFQWRNSISPTALSADTDDYAPTGFSDATVIRMSSTTGVNLNGLAGGSAGRIVLLVNVGSNRITPVDESLSGTSAAANRFVIAGEGFFNMAQNDTALFWYDGTSSRWRHIG